MPAGHAEHEARPERSERDPEVTEPGGHDIQAELAAPVENELTGQDWQVPRYEK